MTVVVSGISGRHLLTYKWAIGIGGLLAEFTMNKVEEGWIVPSIVLMGIINVAVVEAAGTDEVFVLGSNLQAAIA